MSNSDLNPDLKFFKKSIDEIEKDLETINETEEYKKILKSIIKSFRDTLEYSEDYSSIVYLLYAVIRISYHSPECVNDGFNRLLECFMEHLTMLEGDNNLNLYDEKGNRVSLKDLGIEEVEK